MRHLLTLFDLTPKEVREIFAIAADLKKQLARGIRAPLLNGNVLGLLFEKQSLRTRVSFETAMLHCGGGSIYLGQDVGWGERETIADFGRVLSQYLDALVFRGKKHSQMVELSNYCECPVINGLTDVAHPCQALADLFTLEELKGGTAGRTMAFIGDGNNVCRSLAHACAYLDVSLNIASPKGYELDSEFLIELSSVCPNANIRQLNDPVEAVTGADAVYTDVWISMGQEAEKTERIKTFSDFQVNGPLMRKANNEAAFLHCLPAHRGNEVTDDVMDCPESAIVEQAANRMHVQKAILVWLLSRTSEANVRT